jgi:hypothetical protein
MKATYFAKDNILRSRLVGLGDGDSHASCSQRVLRGKVSDYTSRTLIFYQGEHTS